MTPVHTEALNRARQIIRRDFGDLSDLPEELRNTLANTYYKFCHMSMELEGDYAFPDMIALSGDLVKGTKAFIKETSLLQAGVQTLPKVVSAIRSIIANDEDPELAIRVCLDIFKYRIPGVDKKSSLRVKLERPFYAAKVDEIPNLWRLL